MRQEGKIGSVVIISVASITYFMNNYKYKLFDDSITTNYNNFNTRFKVLK